MPRQTSSITLTTKLLIGCVALLVMGHFLQLKADKTDPVHALARAIELIETQKLDEALALLKITKEDTAIKHWGDLYRARALAGKGKQDEARKIYQGISPESAASLDARVALLRLTASNSSSTINDEELKHLASHIVRVNRKDLEPQLMLIRAQHAVSQNDPQMAVAILDDLRTQYPRLPEAKAAREQRAAVITKHSAQFPAPSVDSLFEQIALLTKERASEEALQLIHQVKEQSASDSSDYFRAMLFEEQSLRMQERSEEADRLLLLVSADGSLGTADKAVLKIAKNAWNVNDHHRALQFLDSLQQRFPDSALRHESMYIEARVLEEIHQLPEAKELYAALGASTAELELRIKALDRLAWLYLQSGNYLYATVEFRKARLALQQTGVHKLEKKAQDDYYRAIFWELFALEKLDHESRSKLPYEPPTTGELKEELQAAPRGNYYRYLLKQDIDAAPKPATPAVLSSKTTEKTSSCVQQSPEQLTQRLRTLSSAELYKLVTHEIDWYFARLGSKQPTDEQKAPFSLSGIQRSTTRASLFLAHGNPYRAIQTADPPLRALRNVDSDDPRRLACYEALLRLSYPTPYVSAFQREASKHAIDPALLLAIARTESHFNPTALSRTGAKGVMQLMPNTAKKEGLRPGQDLNNPDHNIALGSKHLAGLLRHYDDEKIFAIAAYNAGGAAVNRWRTRNPRLEPLLWAELIGYPETKNYVRKVLVAEEHYRNLLKQPNSAG